MECALRLSFILRALCRPPNVAYTSNNNNKSSATITNASSHVGIHGAYQWQWPQQAILLRCHCVCWPVDVVIDDVVVVVVTINVLLIPLPCCYCLRCWCQQCCCHSCWPCCCQWDVVAVVVAIIAALVHADTCEQLPKRPARVILLIWQHVKPTAATCFST